MEDTNLHIIKRLLEIARNPLEYSVHPKDFKEEHIFLANVLNDSIGILEKEFSEAFKKIVGHYKMTLKEGKGYGWFHSPEKLEWINTYMNQLKYAVYGDKFRRELKFNDALKNEAYKDFICQIDRTVLMTASELKKHHAEINKISKEIMKEILSGEKNKKV